jgi:FKBP-type peptidyl-prolyl cis-trans isomerase
MKKVYLSMILILSTFFACNQDPSVEEKRASELDELETFVAANYPDAIKTESNLFIVWREHGTGPAVKSGNYVNVRYTGKFLDGTIFDSSDSHGTTFQFTVGAGSVIAAWDEALQLCNVGDKITILAPSTIAYGIYGSGLIPGYTSLLFDIDIIEVLK